MSFCLDTLVDKSDTMIVNSDTSSTMIVNCDSASLLANDVGTMIINDTDDESTMRSMHSEYFVALLSQSVVLFQCLVWLYPLFFLNDF